VFYSEEDVKGLTREDLPVWRWSELVTPESFVEIPPNFTWPEDDDKAATVAPSDEPKKEAQLFRYAKVETQYCVDGDFAYFMKGIYGEEACGDLDWLCKAAGDGSLPCPKIEVDAMEEENILGDHEGDTLYINQRLVLDALRSPDAPFVLFIAMLVEYGNFLGDALREKAGAGGGSPKLAGRAFAYRFMEHSGGDLFNSDFEFADFGSSDAKGEEQRFAVGVSGMSREQKRNVFFTLDSLGIWEEEG
jgi:hypothetical protein